MRPLFPHFNEKDTAIIKVNSSTVEHRAPTEELVKLLAEMEEKAQSRILKKLTVGENFINGVIVESYELTNELNTFVVYTSFTLNGKFFEFKEKRTMRSTDFEMENIFRNNFTNTLRDLIFANAKQGER